MRPTEKVRLAKAMIKRLEYGCCTKADACPNWHIRPIGNSKTTPSRKVVRDEFCHNIFPELPKNDLVYSCGICPCDSDIGHKEIMRRLHLVAR